MSGFNSKRLMALKRYDEQFQFDNKPDWAPAIYLFILFLVMLAAGLWLP